MFGKPSMKKFAMQLAREIRRVNPAVNMEFDSEQSCLTQKDDDGVVNLGNIYHEHCSLSRSDRRVHLQQLAQLFGGMGELELPEDFEDAKKHLRPKIWSRSTFDLMELQRTVDGNDEPFDSPLYAVGSHLYASLVFDTETSMQSITNGTLRDWDVSYYEAHEFACHNLDDSSIAYTRIGDGFHSALSGDNYDSSRVMLLDKIRSMSVEGEHVAIVPHRDAMYVAGSEDETSLSIMLELTKKAVAEEPRPLSPLPVVLRDGQWEDWEPPLNHALRPLFEELELGFLGNLYADQTQLLTELEESGRLEWFPASFSAMQDNTTEQVMSYCVWGREVHTLLPRTQIIVFYDDSGLLASGIWQKVVDVVGDLIVEDESYYPRRYAVREFPSEEQLSAIGKIQPFVD